MRWNIILRGIEQFSMRKIDVVCGVIYDNHGSVLIAQRADDSHRNKWEFPGGKRRENETYEQAIRREILEELSVDVLPQEIIFKHPYEEFDLIFIKCFYNQGIIKLNDHLDYRWVRPDNLLEYDFLSGDFAFINSYSF